MKKAVDIKKTKILNDLYNKLNNYENIWNSNIVLRNNKKFSLDKIESVLAYTLKEKR